MRFRMLFGMCAGLLCNAYAQDQVEIFNGPFTELTTSIPANPRQISVAEARALVEATLQARDHPTPNYVDDPKFYCIIHLVTWKTENNVVSTDVSKWYVFRGGAGWGAADLEKTRIYGSKKIALLGVSWVPSVVTPTADLIRTHTPALSGKADNDPDITSLLNEFANGPISRFVDDANRVLVRAGGLVVVKGYPPDIPLTYRMEITKKLPAPISDLISILGSVGSAQAGAIKIRLKSVTRVIWKGDLREVRYVPSDITVRAQFGTDLKEVDHKDFDNEGTYRFDFSAGLPIRAIKQLQYDTANPSAAPKVVDKYNLYGLVNFFFKPIDVKTDYPLWPPSIVAGLGLTGHPLDRPMVGLGLGYGKLAGFIGAAFNKVSVPAMQPGAAPVASKSHRETKLVFGVNLTARQLAELLKKK